MGKGNIERKKNSCTASSPEKNFLHGRGPSLTSVKMENYYNRLVGVNSFGRIHHWYMYTSLS